MSYDFQQQQGNQGGQFNQTPQTQERPGFSQTSNTFETGSNSNQSSSQNHGGNYQNGNSHNSGYGGGNTGGSYSGGNSSGGSYQQGRTSNSGGYNNSQGGSGYKGGGNSYGGGYSRGGGGGGFKGGGGGRFQRAQLTPEQLQAMPLPKSAVFDGNFNAPEQLIPVIREMADLLKQHGFAIRSSGMNGFPKMVSDNVQGIEFHIPWKEFGQIQNPKSYFNSDECKEFAKRYLPDWAGLKDSHQAFFCKNARLVLGKDLKQPAQISIIWSDDGVEGPTTRTQTSMHAGHIACISKAMHIPVINISNPDAVQRLRRFLEN